ncbi:MAG: hypothetical protein NC231_10700 [Bacillus sp. (in: Bacteria)]|nr:hypothetical protein [Bacillus sp. (in: firmicutes)]MCM1425494.1 hypothetical protein [Eubacterium sp.]
MQECRPKVQLNKKQADLLFYLSLSMLAMFAFLFLGEADYYLIDDSLTYMDITSDMMEGVMPVYPFFLLGNRLLFGEESYLSVVVIEQSVFAVFCVVQLIGFLKNRLQLSYLESYICFGLALLPFMADLPEVVITREILTEGIAYAAYYLFFTALLKTVWNKSYKWCAFLCVVTLFLASIRSQLQILFGVCGAAWFYIVVFGRKTKKKGQIPVCILLGLAGCLVIGLSGVRVTSRIASGYNQMAEKAAEKIGEKQVVEEAGEPEESVQEEVSEETVSEEAQDATANRTIVPVYAASQYVSLVFNKGMYEADYEDYLLFEDERLRDIYLDLYEKVDKEQCRYVYAAPGLWMWQDIAESARIGVICMGAWPEDRAQIGVTLIKAHWGRFLYHMLILMPQAFVSTVFFQIERIYLLCHLITLFLYVSAIAFMIWAYVNKKIGKEYGELMSCVLVTNCILVVAISAVLFGQKRYLFYNFGTFYIAYFLLLLQLWKQYGKNLIRKINPMKGNA